MKNYNKAIVNCKRIAYNPCGLDEYEVTITPSESESVTLYTFAGVFEMDEAICDRMYQQWLEN